MWPCAARGASTESRNRQAGSKGPSISRCPPRTHRPGPGAAHALAAAGVVVLVRGPRAAAALVVGECLEDVGQVLQARQPGPAGLAQRLTLPHRLLHLYNNTQPPASQPASQPVGQEAGRQALQQQQQAAPCAAGGGGGLLTCCSAVGARRSMMLPLGPDGEEEEGGGSDEGAGGCSRLMTDETSPPPIDWD